MKLINKYILAYSINFCIFRHFFSAKMRPKVLQLFDPNYYFNFNDIDDQEHLEEDSPSRITKQQLDILPTLLQNVSVILRIISCDFKIHVEEFEKVCKETHLILIDHFRFMSIYPTVHSVLAHSFDLIRNNGSRGLHAMSEEGSEGAHKVVNHLREFKARKMTLELNLKDTFRRLFFLSDPTLRSMKRVVSCSLCGETGHTIRSCPQKKTSEMTSDDELFESLICRESPDESENLYATQADLDALDVIYEEDEAEADQIHQLP